MSQPRPTNGYHAVSAGENLESIAFLYGFLAPSIWDHPNNADLKKRRQDSCVLAPGDQVYIPELRLRTEDGETNQVHRFKCKNTPALLRFRPLVFGKPLKNRNYTLVVDDGPPITGKVGDDGTIKQYIRPDAKEAKIVVGEGFDKFTYNLSLRTLYPFDGIRGIQQRLKQLGHYHGPEDGVENEETKNAIAMFQVRQGLEVTGTADEKTKLMLVKRHGR
jgi:hypothetical protein